MENTFYLKDILTVDQFNLSDIETIFNQTKKIKQIVTRDGSVDLLKGKIMTALFYEPSSRTFASFITAMQRLGGGFVPLQGVAYSSVSKGETLPDTVRTFASYSDIIVIRHPEVGSAKIAAEFSDKPVINAGDGVGEHPTQALLDLFTINEHFPSLKELNVTMVGDLLNGRTVHSLSKLLALYKKITINLVSPTILKLPIELINYLIKSGITVNQSEGLDEVLKQTDVLYVTRVQKERFTDLTSYEKLKHKYIISPEIVRKMKQTAIVMHPFPRVGEITMDVDLDKRAIYIREQMVNGMYVRMALLSLILNSKH
jgi:aspartate carbamoyltransferase catalytic subunit